MGKKKENLKIVIDPKTEQFLIYKSFFICITILVCGYFLTSCLGNKQVENLAKDKSILDNPILIWNYFKKSFGFGQDKDEKKVDQKKLVKKEEKIDIFSNFQEKKKIAKDSEKKAKKKKGSPKEKIYKLKKNEKFSLIKLSHEQALVKKMKRLIYFRGKYQKSIKISQKSNDLVVIYYRGLAYYSMMLSKKKYSKKQRRSYLKKTLSTLDYVAKNSNQYELKARARLWEASTLDISAKSNQQKQKALDKFFKISKNFPKSHATNDALFYAANSLVAQKRYKKSQKIYNQLLSKNFADKIVYDRHRNLVVSQKRAAKNKLRYLRKIRAIR